MLTKKEVFEKFIARHKDFGGSDKYMDTFDDFNRQLYIDDDILVSTYLNTTYNECVEYFNNQHYKENDTIDTKVSVIKDLIDREVLSLSDGINEVMRIMKG